MVKASHAANELADTATKERTYIAYDHDGRKFNPAFVKRTLEAAERCRRGEFVVIDDWHKHFGTVQKGVRAKATKAIAKTRKKSSAQVRNRP